MKLSILLRVGVPLLMAWLFVNPMGVPEAVADGWGTVSGQFVLDGPVPERKILIHKGDTTAKDAACCAAQDIPADDLVIDPKTKGIQHIFVYMKHASKIYPDLVRPKTKEVVFDQKGCQFIPHTLLVRTGQQVVVKSGDPIAHNTHTYPLLNQPVNFLIKPNDRKGSKVSVVVSEPLPTQVKCDLHPWMKAYWLILNHPYAAITDAQGKFTIENLPAGTQKLTVWHERVGYIERSLKVKVEAGKTTVLDPIKVPLARFESP